MAACSKYMNRFKKALEYRKLPFPQEIIIYMGKRATSDRELDRVIHGVLDIIEPPHCQKSHCPSHTTFGFCGCSQSLVPGRCPLNLEYLKRKRDREESVINKRMADIPAMYLPLSKETREKIIGMNDKQWAAQVKKIPKQLTGKI